MTSIIFTLNNNTLKKDVLDEYKTLIEKSIINNTDLINGEIELLKFSDGELSVKFLDSVRGKRVYILSSPRTSDEVMYLNLAIDSAKRGGATHIIPVIPCFPYQRQDKLEPRGPIGAKIMAEMIEQRGATGIITFDLHADQIQGFFNIPVTHLEGKNVFDGYIASIYNKDTILASPDAGGTKRVKRMKTQLEKYHNIVIDYVLLDKTRKEANIVDSMVIIGDVKGKHVIMIDDMVDTFGTADKAVDTLLENGAKTVRLVASHGILSGQAYNRLYDSKITELIVSDSVQHKGSFNLSTISLAKQIALAMGAINSESSYEGLKNERF